jgi:ketosteroid isomerase-like protein
MSQENVEVVRQSLDAYARRDVAAMRKLNDPEMELDWSASRSWLAGVYRGFDEALRFYEGYFEVFAKIEIEPLSFIEVGESVVVPNVARQWGRDGIAVSARGTFVFTLRRGRIVRTCLFQTTELALEACREGAGIERPAEGQG